MIRKSTINISYANTGKKEELYSLLEESKRVINKYISIFYDNGVFSGFNVTQAIYNLVEDTNFLSSMKQNLAQQALQIVKSQRKKKNKTKPLFNKSSIILDQRMVEIYFTNRSFLTFG